MYALARRLRSLSRPDRDRAIDRLSPNMTHDLEHFWPLFARDKQLPPEGDWLAWLILAGRGFGKTRTLVEFGSALARSGRYRHIGVVAETAADCRDVLVENRNSGFVHTGPEDDRPNYEPSKRRLTWKNGATATLYSGEDPDQLRGPEHDAILFDELAKYDRASEVWDMAMFGLRTGPRPVVVIATTPRPTKIVKDLVSSDTTHVTRGTTYENRPNLSGAFFSEVVRKYEGTRIGRQELNAEILDDVPGALWTRTLIEENRVSEPPHAKDIVRCVVGVDPAVTSGEDSCETGIITVALAANGHAYVLEDASCRMSPLGWGQRAIGAYSAHEADRVIGEVNNGGELVEANLRTIDSKVSYKAVRASRGKRARAEPIAALDEQHMIHHVGGFAELEDQMCNFTPEGGGGLGNDRVDARVWACWELFLERQQAKAPAAVPIVTSLGASSWRI
jgi:phage terminase large subunit-like protein